MDLVSFVRGGISDDLAARIRAAVPAGFFHYPAGLAPSDRHAITYQRLRHAGLTAPPASELLADPAALCALLERAAAADPALFHIMLLHYTLVLAPILRSGDDAIAALRLQLEDMESFGVVCMTEAGRSNSHLALSTTASFDPGTRTFVLTTPDAAATKFPTTAGHPGLPKTAAVYARLVAGDVERGTFIFVVPLREQTGAVADGVQITPAPEPQHLPVDHAAVRFTGLRVPFGAWLAAGAEIDADGTFTDPASQTRLSLTMATAPDVWRGAIAASASIARASAFLLVRHCAGRVAMGGLAPGRPLLSQRSQQEAVITALARGYALTAIASHVKRPADPAEATAAAQSTTWTPWAAVHRDLPLLKAAATAIAEETAALCRVHSGAPGYAASGRLNGYRALAHAFLSAGGDNQLILFDTARGMAAEDLPGRPVDEPSDGASSLEGCLDAAWRLERLLARKLACRVDEPDKAAAWNANHWLAVRTATARADRVVLEILVAGPAQLRTLFHWYALEWYSRRTGVLLDEEVASAPLADAIASQRDKLCGDLLLQADDLIAAFELPELDHPYFWSAAWAPPEGQD